MTVSCHRLGDHKDCLIHLDLLEVVIDGNQHFAISKLEKNKVRFQFLRTPEYDEFIFTATDGFNYSI